MRGRETWTISSGDLTLPVVGRSLGVLVCFAAVVGCGGKTDSADPSRSSGEAADCAERFCFTVGVVAAGAGAMDLEVFDCNDDGHLDIVVANGSAATVSVLEGNGDGFFQAQKTYAAGSDPWTLGRGDLDGDGIDDIAVGNFVAGSTALFGDGRCGFERRGIVVGDDPLGELTSGGRSIAVGDVTEDGVVDVVVSMVSERGTAFHASVVPGAGDGTFSEFEPLSVGADLGDLHVVDVDGDGTLDILGLTYPLSFDPPAVHVLRGEGGGRFADNTPFPVLVGAGTLDVADFDEDGVLDVVASGGASISWLRGRGDGTFDAQATYALGAEATTLTSGDLDGDGHRDVVVALGGTQQVAVLAGDGQGGFATPVGFLTGVFSTFQSPEPNYVAIADVDEDSVPDIIATNRRGHVSLLLSGRRRAEATTPFMDMTLAREEPMTAVGVDAESMTASGGATNAEPAPPTGDELREEFRATAPDTYVAMIRYSMGGGPAPRITSVLLAVEQHTVVASEILVGDQWEPWQDPQFDNRLEAMFDLCDASQPQTLDGCFAQTCEIEPEYGYVSQGTTVCPPEGNLYEVVCFAPDTLDLEQCRDG